MARRVYYLDPKGKRIRQEALLTMRETKKALGPDLLDKARAGLAAFAENRHAHKELEDAPGDSVPVDMKKNLTIVMKYLEMNEGNKHLYRQIQTLLSEAR